MGDGTEEVLMRTLLQVLTTTPSSSSSSSSSKDKKEKEEDGTSTSSTSTSSTIPLSFLIECIEQVVRTFAPGSSTLTMGYSPSSSSSGSSGGGGGMSLRNALSSRARAEVLHTILKLGNSSSGSSPADMNKWRALQQQFMEMATRG